MSFDIEKLYKENTDKVVPDMDKLWDRIESRLDEQEKADSKTDHDITPAARTRRKKLSALIAVAACAVIAVTGAFVVMNRNEVRTDKSKGSSISQSEKKSGISPFGTATDADETNYAEIAVQNDETAEEYTPEQDNNDEAEIAAVENEQNNDAEQLQEAQPNNNASFHGDKDGASRSYSPSAEKSSAASASTGGTSTASDNTAASDTAQSAEDISGKIEARVNEVLDSEEYQNADASQKAELVTALFEELVREGAVLSYSVDEVTGEAYCTGSGFTVTVTLGI